MDKAEGIEYLKRDGDLRVPCSRYGRSTYDCAEVAWAASVIVGSETGSGVDKKELDHMMGLVVNDHDDVEYLIKNYGPEHGFNPAELLQ